MTSDRKLIELDAALYAIKRRFIDRNQDFWSEAFDTGLKEALSILRALPAVAPADPLGAEWMRTEAMTALNGVADNWSCGHDAMHCDCHRDIEQWRFAADEILAIPAPTDDTLDRAALARPKVRKLVEVVSGLTGHDLRTLGKYRQLRAALAALPNEPTP